MRETLTRVNQRTSTLASVLGWWQETELPDVTVELRLSLSNHQTSANNPQTVLMEPTLLSRFPHCWQQRRSVRAQHARLLQATTLLGRSCLPSACSSVVCLGSTCRFLSPVHNLLCCRSESGWTADSDFSWLHQNCLSQYWQEHFRIPICGSCIRFHSSMKYATTMHEHQWRSTPSRIHQQQ